MKDHTPPPLREAWIIFFLLGVVMLNFPFIAIFNKTTPVLGIPALVLYLLLGWPLSIVVVYFFSRRLGNNSGAEGPEDEDRKG